MGFGRHPFFFFEKKYNKYEQRETVPSPSIRSSVPRRRSRARRRGLSPFVPRTSVALPRAHAGTRARTIERPKDAGRSSPVPRAFFGGVAGASSSLAAVFFSLPLSFGPFLFFSSVLAIPRHLDRRTHPPFFFLLARRLLRIRLWFRPGPLPITFDASPTGDLPAQSGA